MKRELEIERQDKIELQVVSPLQIVCPRCGSDSYFKWGFIKSSGKQRYCCKKCKYQFVLFPGNPRLVAGEDIWTAADLGMVVSPYKSGNKLNFARSIHQDWLKTYIKKFIRYKASQTSSFSHLQVMLVRLAYFSQFLLAQPTVKQVEDITREVIIDFVVYLSQRSLSPDTRGHAISALASFFEVGSANSWFIVEPYLIHKEDYPKRNKTLPRYIPEEVMTQLNQHLDKLPQPVMRMVLVIQECGLRIGELCQLPLDCLKQDSKGGWFIQFMRWKMKFETTLPISIELAQVIKEQQAYILENLGKDYQYLFCGRSNKVEFVPVPKLMNAKSFTIYLQRLAEQFNICDSTGKRWLFQPHQFRHTVGTRMINSGVSQHIIQRYLGHDSPQMTAVYAHIHDATLKKEIDKYLDTKIVNINGEVIESLSPELDSDDNLQWMKKKVLAETLANGYCGLPAQLTCSKGNACLTCGDFRTTIEFLDQHKQHLERTKKVLKVAETNGWQRQIQVNQDVKKSLEKIIGSLEEKQDE